MVSNLIGWPGVRGEEECEVEWEWESMVGLYRGLEFRRGFEVGAGIDDEGWMGAGGARVGLLGVI